MRRSAGRAALVVLIVATGCTGTSRDGAQPAPTRAATAALKDALIRSAIKAALVADVGAVRVTVQVDGGVATLAGTTPDAKTKAGALSAARDTAGVRNVVDRIRVAGP